MSFWEMNEPITFKVKFNDGFIKEVEGILITSDVFPDYQFVLHEYLNSDKKFDFSISELTTGRRIATGHTIEHCEDNAADRLTVNHDIFLLCIDNCEKINEPIEL